MRIYPAESADRSYFVGFPKHSECGGPGASSGERRLVEDEFVVTSSAESWSTSDRPILDLVAGQLVDGPATAIPTREWSLQDDPVVRMPRALERPAVAGLPRVTDEEVDLSGDVFIASETWVVPPLARRPHYASASVKVFLTVCLIGAPIAFVFGFASARPSIDIASLWAALTVGRQATAPAPLETLPSSTIEPPSIPVTTAANNEIQMSPHSPAGQESSPSRADVATASTALPNETPSPVAAWQLPALSTPTEAERIVTRTGPDTEVQTPSVQTAPRSDEVPNSATAKVTAPAPLPVTDDMTIDNGPADLRSTAMPAILPGESPSLRDAGIWTYCAVSLIPTGQIAVQKAMTYNSCISAGKKCAGQRRYADIQFFDRPTLTSKVPLELCDKEN